MRSAVEELLHRVNNLLGTIGVQCAAAEAIGTLHAHQQALRMIAESAGRTQEEIARFRAGGGPTAVTSPAAT